MGDIYEGCQARVVRGSSSWICGRRVNRNGMCGTHAKAQERGAVSPAATPDEWITVNQAAESLGVSQKTVRRWIAQGHIPAERLGARLIRIKASDLRLASTPIVPTEPK